MCFSANASFVASGILFLVSMFSLRESSKKQVFLALVPFFFAIQQLAEGFTWLALNNSISGNLLPFFSYIYLVFAVGFWPIWIPLSLFVFESKELRKKFLNLILFLGYLVSGYSLFWLFKNGARAAINNHHIFYDLKIPKTSLDLFLYAICVSVPFFISSQKWAKFFGILLLLGLAISYLFYLETFTSIWCFFAAFLSVFVYLIIKNK